MRDPGSCDAGSNPAGATKKNKVKKNKMKKRVNGKTIYRRQPRIDEYGTVKIKKKLKGQTSIDDFRKKREKGMQLDIFSAINRRIRDMKFEETLKAMNKIEKRIKELEKQKQKTKFTGWMKDKAENEINKEIKDLKKVQKKLDEKLSEM